MMFDPIQSTERRPTHAPGAATTAPRAMRTRRHHEETPHAASDEMSTRARARQRHSSAWHSIRTSILRHHAHSDEEFLSVVRVTSSSRRTSSLPRRRLSPHTCRVAKICARYKHTRKRVRGMSLGFPIFARLLFSKGPK